MVYSTDLAANVEKWWRHLDNIMHVAESLDDIKIGECIFRSWGDKHYYDTKTRCTDTYLRTFQSIVPVENRNGETVYPILYIYFDICKGRKRTTYKKIRCHLSC